VKLVGRGKQAVELWRFVVLAMLLCHSLTKNSRRWTIAVWSDVPLRKLRYSTDRLPKNLQRALHATTTFRFKALSQLPWSKPYRIPALGRIPRHGSN
jgi:hypothetical protein